MGANPPTTFSPDGLWWWDGAEWRPAVSPDGTWRWDGRAWVPAQPAGMPLPARAGGGRNAVIIGVAAFGGVFLLVLIVTLAVLYTMGNQIANVFSNVAAALGATPSP